MLGFIYTYIDAEFNLTQPNRRIENVVQTRIAEYGRTHLESDDGDPVLVLSPVDSICMLCDWIRSHPNRDPSEAFDLLQNLDPCGGSYLDDAFKTVLAAIHGIRGFGDQDFFAADQLRRYPEMIQHMRGPN